MGVRDMLFKNQRRRDGHTCTDGQIDSGDAVGGITGAIPLP